jgi:hypothetical protein
LIETDRRLHKPLLGSDGTGWPRGAIAVGSCPTSLEFSTPHFRCGFRRLANPSPFTHNQRERDQFLINPLISIHCPGGFMVAVQSRISRACFMLATALSAALLAGAAHAYTPEEQQACSPDAFRLCGDAIPDVDRVTACMIRKKSELSPGCRVYFRSPEPVAAPAVTAHRPVRITPVTARKPVSVKPRPVSVKPKKPKKPARPASAT